MSRAGVFGPRRTEFGVDRRLRPVRPLVQRDRVRTDLRHAHALTAAIHRLARLTAAIHMDNPYCGCKLTHVPGRSSGGGR